jgi:hypothetical protein
LAARARSALGVRFNLVRDSIFAAPKKCDQLHAGKTAATTNHAGKDAATNSLVLCLNYLTEAVFPQFLS